MEQLVKVLTVHDDGTAKVMHIRQSACSGDCHKCSGCGAAQETIILTARNAIGARAGDLVIVESATGPVLAAASILYILPLVLFFVGYGLGAALWQKGALLGGIAFILGILAAVTYDRLVAKKKKTVYTITRYDNRRG